MKRLADMVFSAGPCILGGYFLVRLAWLGDWWMLVAAVVTAFVLFEFVRVYIDWTMRKDGWKDG